MSSPDNPQDAVVANQYKDNTACFDKTAREWTTNYANPDKLKKEKIHKITEMGFTREQAISALEKCDCDEELAIQSLLN